MMEHPQSVEIIPFEGPRELATVTAKPPTLFLPEDPNRKWTRLLGGTSKRGLAEWRYRETQAGQTRRCDRPIINVAAKT
jgi:hypothetical protein